METGKLKLGKGAAFVKSHLRRLRQEDETWQVDFRALPKPMRQVKTRYIGFVVTDPDRILVESFEVESTPTVNDLATSSSSTPMTGFMVVGSRSRKSTCFRSILFRYD